MQKIMEILSPTATRADSGSGSRQAARTSNESYGSGFNQVFEQELGNSDSRKFNAGRRSSETFETIKPKEQNLIDDDEDLDGIAQTAGVIQNPQSEIVFILEGNMESAEIYNPIPVEEAVPQEAVPQGAVPQEAVPQDSLPQEAAPQVIPQTVPQESAQIINNRDTQTQPQAAKEIPQDFIQILDDEIAEAVQKEVVIKQVAEIQNAETTTTKQAGAANVEVNNANDVSHEQKIDTNPIAASDVEARMPEVMTESQESTGNKSNFSKNDNLSPLENENGANSVEVQEQSEKTYSEAQSEESARSSPGETASTEAPTVTNETLPPLMDGIKPEQFRAVQQMTEATLSQPVKPENLFQELVYRVELMQSATESTMTIKLNPEHLGNVALEVAISAAGLHIRMNVEDAGVRGMINSQLAALIESLEEKGIEVAEVEVDYTAMEFGHSAFKGDPRDYHDKSGSKSQNRNNREVNSKEGVEYYTTLPDIMDYYLDTGVSSVEFSA